MNTMNKILYVVIITAALFLPTRSAIGVTRQDVDNYVAGLPQLPGCLYLQKDFTSSCLPGIKVVQRCNANIKVRSEYTLRVLSSRTINVIDCCTVGSCPRWGSWETGSAVVDDETTYCNGSKIKTEGTSSVSYIKGDTGTGEYFCGWLTNYGYYPLTIEYQVSCDSNDSELQTFFPVCAEGDCCTVGACCTVQ